MVGRRKGRGQRVHGGGAGHGGEPWPALVSSRWQCSRAWQSKVTTWAQCVRDGERDVRGCHGGGWPEQVGHVAAWLHHGGGAKPRAERERRCAKGTLCVPRGRVMLTQGLTTAKDGSEVKVDGGNDLGESELV